MFLFKHRLKIASLRIEKHRIVKKTEHRPPLDTVGYRRVEWGHSRMQYGGYNVSVGENHINSPHAFAQHKRKILQLKKI